MNYIIKTVCTSKMPFEKSGFSVFDHREEKYNGYTLAEIRQIIKDTYPKCKRVPMYRDDENGKPVKVGYIYCFKNKDISHDSGIWYQQDWVEIIEATYKTVI